MAHSKSKTPNVWLTSKQAVFLSLLSWGLSKKIINFDIGWTLEGLLSARIPKISLTGSILGFIWGVHEGPPKKLVISVFFGRRHFCLWAAPAKTKAQGCSMLCLFRRPSLKQWHNLFWSSCINTTSITNIYAWVITPNPPPTPPSAQPTITALIDNSYIRHSTGARNIWYPCYCLERIRWTLAFTAQSALLSWYKYWVTAFTNHSLLITGGRNIKMMKTFAIVSWEISPELSLVIVWRR